MKMALEAKDLRISLSGTVIFSSLNFSIPEGQIIAFCGSSGIGKTTLLKCLTLLELPERGSLFLKEKKYFENGEVIDKKIVREKLGIVFQDFYLWDNKRVLENITEALVYVKRLNSDEAKNIAKDLMSRLQLSSDFEVKYPPELSRGQRQRVAIARTLAMDPEILLLDEPTASLDEALAGRVAEMIRSLQDMGKTILVVTHDVAFAKLIGDEVIQFSDISRSEV